MLVNMGATTSILGADIEGSSRVLVLNLGYVLLNSNSDQSNRHVIDGRKLGKYLLIGALI